MKVKSHRLVRINSDVLKAGVTVHDLVRIRPNS